ncbi:hypothetical protein E2F46_07550 [Luteimonas aestuarii]|uniref:Uncharacterized protein n=2 Tax=Luteimonas aestuarii TaxID=453837 RepID=A0A4R5TVM2_9GAMM|nr:hypothetical protein E2F46_07550 [Luteimonas aestuarii]
MAMAVEPVPAEIARDLARVADIADDPESGRRAQALWGLALDAPVLLIEPSTRRAWRSDPASGQPLRVALREGQLPANTCIEVDGAPMVMLMLPLADDDDALARLLWHERWHCEQDALGLPAEEGDNAHLDGEAGRTWLRLELRALSQAIASDKDAAARGHAQAALAFRARRSAQGELGTDVLAQEARLERNEGLAEYSGRVASAADPAPALLEALHTADANDGFVRSMAYATGPAYGLLLDRWRDGWRAEVGGQSDLPSLLAQALPPSEVEAGTAGLDYGIVEVRAAERERAVARARRADAYRSRFVEGLTLRLPMRDPAVSFDPRTLFPLGDAGTVYGTLTVRSAWGELLATEGALMAPDWSGVTVDAATLEGCGATWTGQGWTLSLSSGWRLLRTDDGWRVYEGLQDACAD